MTLLDEARRLLEPTVSDDVSGPGEVYVYCGGRVADGHREPCNLAAVPRIVAALEAAERLVARCDSADKREANALINALVAALKGTA